MICNKIENNLFVIAVIGCNATVFVYFVYRCVFLRIAALSSSPLWLVPCPYMSLPCHQGDVEYAFEQLDSGSFVASVSVAALEPIAGYPELKKADRGRSGEIGEAGWPGQQLEQ